VTRKQIQVVRATQVILDSKMALPTEQLGTIWPVRESLIEKNEK
jgi:hypothetical protein